jgi:hypothetical protein
LLCSLEEDGVGIIKQSSEFFPEQNQFFQVFTFHLAVDGWMDGWIEVTNPFSFMKVGKEIL